MYFKQNENGEWEWNENPPGIFLGFGFTFKDEAEFVGIPPSVAAQAFAKQAREYAEEIERQFVPRTPGAGLDKETGEPAGQPAAEGKSKPKGKKKAAKE